MKTSNTFAKDYSFFKYLWIFIIGCVVGFIYETILGIFQHGYLQNRQQLLYGPFIPVYGLGAILFMYISKHFKSGIVIFTFCTIFGTLLEFLYSLIQEKIFGTISWDYSNTICNVQGRICLIYSLGWGLLGLVFCKFIYPYLSNLIEKIPLKLGYFISYITILFMIFNVSITILSSLRQKQRYNNIPPLSPIAIFLDKYYPNHILNEIYETRKRINII